MKSSFYRGASTALFSRSDTRPRGCVTLLGWKALYGQLPAHTHSITAGQDLHLGSEVIMVSKSGTYRHWQKQFKSHMMRKWLSYLYLNLALISAICFRPQWRAGGFDNTFYRWTHEPRSDQTHPNFGLRGKRDTRVWAPAEGTRPGQRKAQEGGGNESFVYILTKDYCLFFIVATQMETWSLGIVEKKIWITCSFTHLSPGFWPHQRMPTGAGWQPVFMDLPITPV